MFDSSRTRTLLLVLVCSVCTASAAAESFNSYKDIYLKEEMGRLIFGNSKLTLEFDNTSGQWQSLAAKGTDGNMISPYNFATIEIMSRKYRIPSFQVKDPISDETLRYSVLGCQAERTCPECNRRVEPSRRIVLICTEIYPPSKSGQK